MCRTGKLFEVESDLCQQTPGGHSINSRYRLQPRDRFRERAHTPVNLGFDLRHLAFRMPQIFELVMQHETMVLRDASFQCRLQELAFVAQQAFGHFRQFLAVFFSRYDRLQHGSTRSS